MDVINTNSLALAYMGDAVYEVYIRKHLIDKGISKGDELQRQAVKYVSAKGQAAALRKIEDELTDDEKDIVRRAKNHKMPSRPRTQDLGDYKLATGLEALIGAKYLMNETGRLEEVIASAIAAIEEDN